MQGDGSKPTLCGRMEDELKCPLCRRLYSNPVRLPCTHSLCLACAQSVQAPATQFQNATPPEDPTVGTAEHPPGTNPENPEPTDEGCPDVDDKLSVVSETDSGVVCNSRPNSYVGSTGVGTWINSVQGHSFGISCPVCKKVVLLDDSGASKLPPNRVLENIVDKYGESKQYDVHCQLCEGGVQTPATQLCEQCEIFYCDQCRENCHPARGPLAKHSLVSSADGKTLLRSRHRNRQWKCHEHPDEKLSMFCQLCKTSVCCMCVADGRHINHEVQAAGSSCKAQKVRSLNSSRTPCRQGWYM